MMDLPSAAGSTLGDMWCASLCCEANCFSHASLTFMQELNFVKAVCVLINYDIPHVLLFLSVRSALSSSPWQTAPVVQKTTKINNEEKEV